MDRTHSLSGHTHLGNQPLRDDGDLVELLMHAWRRLRIGSSIHLAPLGLTHAQGRILRMVASSREPRRMADLAERAGVVPRTMTAMVDALQTAGLVARTPDPSDRRSLLVELQPAGKRLIDRLDKARRANAHQMFGSLSSEERSQLVHLLQALCERGDCNVCGGNL